MSRNKKNWDALVDERGQYYNPNIGSGGGGGGGQKGEKGAPGTAAPLLDFQGTVATVGALPTTGNTEGDTYFISSTNEYKTWDGTQWVDGGQAVKGEPGQDGAKGTAATVAVGTTTSVADGSESVTNSGTAFAAVLDFALPKGEPGTNGLNGNVGTPGQKGAPGVSGTSATVAAGTTTTVDSTTPASVTNSGTTSAAVFDFSIPKGEKGSPGNQKGDAATVNVGTTTTAPSSSPASVANSGTTSAAIFDFTIPKGEDGSSATVAVGTTTTVPSTSPAAVVNSGTASGAVLDFSIPKGEKGAPGNQKGDAATVNVGTTTTGASTAPAAVTNSGTTSAAIFDFTIPKGEDGVSPAVTVGTTTTVSSSTPASVADSGTAPNVQLDFTIPKGEKGAPGNQKGSAATVDVGTTTSTDYSFPAQVTNSGNTSAAIFDFSIPKGQKGADGTTGITGNKGEPGTSITGDKGEKGTAAPLLSFQGSVANAAALPAQPQPAGDTYYNLESGRYVTSDGAAYGDAGQMIKGDDGVKGEPGKGEQGNKGEAGVDGRKGERGPTGLTGLTGSIGNTGGQGQKGAPGASVTGPKGSTGSAAALLQFIGNVSTLANLPAQPQTAGDTYLVEDENIYYSSDGAAWNAAGAVVKGEPGVKGDTGTTGIKGEPGAQGDEGVTGQTGLTGATGDAGPKGEPSDVEGPKGPAGTVAIASTVQTDSTVDANVTNSGTAQAAVLTFSIPKGEKGLRGFDGPAASLPAAAVSAHINFSGVTANGQVPTGDINAVHAISGVEKLGTGNWRITFTDAFAGATEYTCVGSIGNPGTGISTGVNLLFTNQTTTTVEVFAERSSNGNQYDPETVQCAFYGTGTGGAIVQKGEPGTPGGPEGPKGFQGPIGPKGTKGLMPVGAANAHTAFNASAGAAFNFSTDTISKSNISNIVREEQGIFTVYFTDAFADANYTVIASAGKGDHTNSNRTVSIDTQLPGSVKIICESDGGAQFDEAYIALVIYGTGTQGNVAIGPKGFKGDPGGQKGDTGSKGIQGIKGQVPAGAVTAQIAFNGEATIGNIPLTGSDVFSSYGIASIEKTAEGKYSVVFTDAFTAADSYTIVGTAGGRDFSGVAAGSRTVNPITMNAGNCTFFVERADTGAESDVPYVSLVFYGTGAGTPPDQKGRKGEPGTAGGPQGDKGNQGDIGFKFVYASFDASTSATFAWANDEIASFGIANVTRLGIAEYRVDFTAAFDTANYGVQITTSNSNSAAASWAQITSRTSSSLTFQTRQNGLTYATTGEAADTLDQITVHVSGIVTP